MPSPAGPRRTKNSASDGDPDRNPAAHPHDPSESDRTTKPPHEADDRPSLRRRTLLSSMPAAMALAGCLSEPKNANARDVDQSQPEPPFDVRTIDAPGSEAGTLALPKRETVTVCTFTRTRCPTNEAYLDVVGYANERVTDERVQFVSLVRYGLDPTREDEAFADWWAEHGGAWPLGIDDRGVFSYYEIDDTPWVVVLGGDGAVLLAKSATSGEIERTVAEGLEKLELDN